MLKESLQALLGKMGVRPQEPAEMQVLSPIDGLQIFALQIDTAQQVGSKIVLAAAMQERWAEKCPNMRAEMLQKFADAVEVAAEDLTQIIHIEAGKTVAEAAGEVTNFVKVMRTNCEAEIARNLPDLGIMQRQKIYKPVGVVALITSYNFPLAVAGWTLAPALLAGNAVVWKPSEKTPLTALAVQAIFAKTLPDVAPLLQVAIGAAEVGKAVVEHKQIAMVSATGSVGMAQAILQVHKGKVPPVLEAGGNNAVVVSQANSPENLKFALQSIISSFLAGGGQKCTNTRRLFVHSAIYAGFVGDLKTALKKFIAGGCDGYGYAPLIDGAAFVQFEAAKRGQVSFGARRLQEQFPNAFYVEPALVELPTQTEIMHHECFAPLLYIVKYDDFSAAVEAVNAPENAGLVNGIYTQSRAEFEEFAAKNEAGHTVVNSPTGTGTPAHGMGFGGNKLSGQGEILNGENQLLPFTLGANRVAVNGQVELS